MLAGDGYGMPAGEVRGARLVAVDFAEDFAQALASLMDLGFRIAYAAVEDFGDFVVFVTVQIVKKEHPLVAFRKTFDRRLKIYAVEHA